LYIKKKRHTQKKEFTDIRLAKNFYIMYTLKQLKNLVKKAKRKDGLFEQNFLNLMECRLPSFIYRTSFLPNMFESLYYIKEGNVAVNKVFRPLIFFSIKMMDIITFRI
jgi:ribosomal protein S4